ncbi:MAG: FecR domain-containing protein, partial [Fuerstiella sp.]|nr:FecR domain-containing protein [Fuerstiella sp.]
MNADDEHMRLFTDAVMFDQQIQSATVAVEEQTAAASFNTSAGATPARSLKRSGTVVIAIALIALLAMALWPQHPADETFATLEQSRAAFWESGDLSTADGSRLGQGTLRLAEGLATLKFDSGAEVVLEAPATLILADAMNCELTRGTVVSDMPESAHGFRIKTPSADVVDYGTRFAVSVYEETGETHTQVIEGRVQVEHQQSD